MTDVILETRQLTKAFKGFTAVNGVDLKVERGHIHALIGPNGAGKTTCFNLLTKFLTPTSGQILFNGRDITTAAPARIARMGIIRSFQISAVFPHLSVLQNVRMQSAGKGERVGTVMDLYIGVMPFMVVMLVLIALLVAFPAIATWLPATMRG